MQTLVLAQVHAHRALPESPVVRGAEMKELVDDDVVDKVALKREQVCAERQGADVEHEGLLATHRTHSKHVKPPGVGPARACTRSVR